ncbi:MAG: galactokinase [Synoicihabitans sp.]
MLDRITNLFRESYQSEPAVIARAPGRIEFIGNHTDYNGGVVLGAAVDRGIWVAASPREDGRRRWKSGETGETIETGTDLTKLQGSSSWINYPQGVVAALEDFGLQAPQGFDFVVDSDLPVGAGLSSSAAIELASALAFLALTHQSVDTETLVKIGRKAENDFVGVPCGILDQGSSGFGETDKLVFIDCRGPKFSTVPIPPDTHFWIFNTHTKHALVDGLYSARHTECMAAAADLGVKFLADASLELFQSEVHQLSPTVAKRARHIIEEIDRVGRSITALESGDLDEVGALLTASHRSSQHAFENSTPELDSLVDALNRVPSVYGARLTGGGFGGAVMSLTSRDFGEAEAEVVATAYRNQWGASPQVIHMRTGEGARLIKSGL